MIKIKVTKKVISVIGHAGYGEYGKDIVCASASSIIMTSVEGIARISPNALTVLKKDNRLDIVINQHDVIIDKLLDNMIICLKELIKQYPQNIKISN